MRKTLNLNEIEERAIINILKINESVANQYSDEPYRISRINNLAVVQSILKKLGQETQPLKDSIVK